MTWEYHPLPDALRLPPCPRCLNRGRVSQFAQWSYYCGDCAHAFVAIWRDDARTVKSTSTIDALTKRQQGA